MLWPPGLYSNITSAVLRSFRRVKEYLKQNLFHPAEGQPQCLAFALPKGRIFSERPGAFNQVVGANVKELLGGSLDCLVELQRVTGKRIKIEILPNSEGVFKHHEERVR
jgi:hypothetical protein